MVTARSTPNIALIKYWGNRNDELRLPAADSLSMTLDGPHVDVTVETSDTFSVSSFDAQGVEKKLSEKDMHRFQRHLDLTNQYIASLFPAAGSTCSQLRGNMAITIRSQIPRGIGIASSAAVFSALAEAYGALIEKNICGAEISLPHKYALSRKDISIIARLGSGSAARSVFGGYVALRASGKMQQQEVSKAYAEQIAPESHWLLHDIIVVPSQEEKKVGSTEGHALAHTSPLFKDRLAAIPRRMRECEDAIRTHDFEKLQRVAEEDCLDMHEIMRTSTPSLQYLSEDTFRITRATIDLREREHLEVLYTMDAGPTVHLFCTDEAVDAVREFTNSQKRCTVIETKTGMGSRTI